MASSILTKWQDNCIQSIASLETQADEQRQEKEKLEAAIYTLLDEVGDATDGDLTVRANLDNHGIKYRCRFI